MAEFTSVIPAPSGGELDSKSNVKKTAAAEAVEISHDSIYVVASAKSLKKLHEFLDGLIKNPFFLAPLKGGKKGEYLVVMMPRVASKIGSLIAADEKRLAKAQDAAKDAPAPKSIVSWIKPLTMLPQICTSVIEIEPPAALEEKWIRKHLQQFFGSIMVLFGKNVIDSKQAWIDVRPKEELLAWVVLLLNHHTWPDNSPIVADWR